MVIYVNIYLIKKMIVLPKIFVLDYLFQQKIKIRNECYLFIVHQISALMCLLHRM
jgi:hypothetical protein